MMIMVMVRRKALFFCDVFFSDYSVVVVVVVMVMVVVVMVTICSVIR